MCSHFSRTHTTIQMTKWNHKHYELYFKIQSVSALILATLICTFIMITVQIMYFFIASLTLKHGFICVIFGLHCTFDN